VKRALGAFFVLTFVVGVAIGPAWAVHAPELSKQCQQALKKTPNKDAEKLCGEGDKLLKEGKAEEATKKFEAGLDKLGVNPATPAKKPSGY
jgi:outer membrane protein assembly factor BamD (BamD/ComL family)